MNMFKTSHAKSIEEYLEQVPEPKKKLLEFIHGFIKKTVPSLKPYFASNMIGYGSFKYKNYKKEVIDWPIIAVAMQKNYISIYVCSIIDGVYVAEKFRENLGKVSIGKSCIRFKSLEDLNIETLEKVLKTAEKHPGLLTKN